MTVFSTPTRLQAVALLTFVALFGAAGTTAADTALQRIARDLEEDSTISHLRAGQVEGILAEDSVVLFDVREADEYAVSHLPGAIQVSPDMETDAFIRQFGALLEGKQAVFYCSTGRRSTRFAESLQSFYAGSGRQPPLANLKGGIFNWHNEQKPLVDGQGQTELVHPYNWFWKRLLERPEFTSYEPVRPAE